jgi:hypothetical protein
MCATGLGQFAGLGVGVLAWVLVMAALSVCPWWFVPSLLGLTAVTHIRSESKGL